MDFCDYFGYGFTTIKPNGLYIVAAVAAIVPISSAPSFSLYSLLGRCFISIYTG